MITSYEGHLMLRSKVKGRRGGQGGRGKGIKKDMEKAG